MSTSLPSCGYSSSAWSPSVPAKRPFLRKMQIFGSCRPMALKACCQACSSFSGTGAAFDGGGALLAASFGAESEALGLPGAGDAPAAGRTPSAIAFSRTHSLSSRASSPFSRSGRQARTAHSSSTIRC